MQREGAFVKRTRIALIDRSEPFRPEVFFGPGWDFWRGPAAGTGLSGEIEQDARSVVLTELDVLRVRRERNWGGCSGEDFLAALRGSGSILLDAGVLSVLFHNPRLIPWGWLDRLDDEFTSVFFFGSVLRSADGHRCVPCLTRERRTVRLDCRRLDLKEFAGRPAVVLAGAA